jgi:TusA-related sulfurtransferase
MLPDAELNLTGHLPPICLLQCKKQLNEMIPGEVVCICLQDKEILGDLELIVERSKDKIIRQQKEDDLYRVYIRKG